MHSKVEERKNDLRNTTVLEVILAVIIILLCVVYMKDVDIKTLEKSNEAKILELTNENNLLIEKNRALEKENRQLKKEVKRLERKIKRLVPLRPGEKSRTDAYEKIIEELERQIEQLKLKIALVEASKGRLPKSDDGKGGRDKPSCLKENGKIQYFAEVSRKGNLFVFSPTGSVSNQSTVAQVPGATALFSGSAITLDKFKRESRRVFKHGQSSNPSCVYYVKLDPSEWLGSELKTLEQYFYKKYQ